MGLLVQNNNVTINDGSGNLRFTTDRRMPHLLMAYSGSISVPNIRGTCTFTSSTGYGGVVTTSRNPFTWDQTLDFTIATDSRISGSDAFVMPFFSISGGDIDTAGGAITGSGSSIVRLLVDSIGYYAGAIVLSPIVSGNSLILRIRNTVGCSGGDIANYPFVDNYDSSFGYQSTDLSGTASTIGYRIYYGRFT